MYRSNYAYETQIRPWAGKWLGISPTYIHVCVKHAMDLQQRKRKRRTCVCGSNLSHSAYYNHVCTERPGQYSDGSDSDFELEMASNLEDRSFQEYSNDRIRTEKVPLICLQVTYLKVIIIPCCTYEIVAEMNAYINK